MKRFLSLPIILAALGLTAGQAQAAGPSAPTASSATLAKVVVSTSARSGPGSGRVVSRLGVHARLYGGANQLLVLDSQERAGKLYLKVRLPARPNTSSGWVDADSVVTHTTNMRVDIDLSSRTVKLQRAGKTISSSRAVVGTRRTPTPTGLFAVSETVPQPAGSELGGFVIALTSHSDVHKTFAGGDGRIGIHGYERLGARLGTASSNGCIRLPMSMVKRIASSVEAGTPVNIHP